MKKLILTILTAATLASCKKESNDDIVVPIEPKMPDSVYVTYRIEGQSDTYNLLYTIPDITCGNRPYFPYNQTPAIYEWSTWWKTEKKVGGGQVAESKYCDPQLVIQSNIGKIYCDVRMKIIIDGRTVANFNKDNTFTPPLTVALKYNLQSKRASVDLDDIMINLN